MSIGTTIKRLRKEKDFTQEQLAEYLGISAQAVSGWECDKCAPDVYQIPVLAQIFNVSADVILEINANSVEIEINIHRMTLLCWSSVNQASRIKLFIMVLTKCLCQDFLW